MMSGKSFEISEKTPYQKLTWWEMRPHMIQMPASTWRELKKWIIKTCKNNDQCESSVSNWERTVNSIDEQVEAKLPKSP
jgi:hypothetical protein